VDDPDLRVHVHGMSRARPSLEERAREEPAVPAVRSLEQGDLAAGVLFAVVGLRRQEHEQAELVRGRIAELRSEDLDDLRRPEELALEVDQRPRRAKCANVALEDLEFATGQRLVDLLRHRPDELDLDRPGLPWRSGAVEPLTR